MEDDFLKVAKKAALEAGKVIQKYYGKQHKLSYKEGDKSNFATKADLEAEEEIVEILTKNFPEHNIISEEKTNIKKGSEYTWAVDPIDGSISFVYGVPYFSVSIGLLKDNQPVLGVIFNVGFNNLYWAETDQGAYLNDKPIHVSQRRSLDEAGMVLDFGHSKRRQQRLDQYINLLITKIAYAYSFGSAVASMALVAEGILDGNVNQAWIWDYVAGTVIIREAGGKVTDFEGKEPDWTKERLSIVASNGLIHEQILEALK